MGRGQLPLSMRKPFNLLPGHNSRTISPLITVLLHIGAWQPAEVMATLLTPTAWFGGRAGGRGRRAVGRDAGV